MDNAWVPAAMAEFGPNARGTVALDPDVDVVDLEKLDRHRRAHYEYVDEIVAINGDRIGAGDAGC